MKYEYKNSEELYFSYYLDELKKIGIISDYTYEEETFELSGDVKYSYTKITKLKTKTKVEDITKSLLKPCTYTPDFVITFPKAIKGFCGVIDTLGAPLFIMSGRENKCYVDVKGVYAGKTNSTQYTFPIKQKWMYQKYSIYTNKVVPYKLFENTFTPYKVMKEEVYKRDIVKRGIKKGDTKLKFNLLRIKDWLQKMN